MIGAAIVGLIGLLGGCLIRFESLVSLRAGVVTIRFTSVTKTDSPGRFWTYVACKSVAALLFFSFGLVLILAFAEYRGWVPVIF